MIRVDKKNDVRLSYFARKIGALLRQGGGVDYGGCYILGSPKIRGNSDLW